MNKRTTLIIRIISILCALALISGILLTFLYADSDTPSIWAEEDIKKAIRLGLVPEELRSNYTAPIKRNEYAALAVQLYKKSGKQIIIRESNIYTDIEGDYYQKQLIEAYNMRIINGYPDKSFKPANNISREEIANLIVNLITALFPEDELKDTISYDFYDKDKIDEWALPFLNYCYSKGFIKGIAPMTIGPKAATTREQAIIMLYRLAVARELLNQDSIQPSITGDGQTSNVNSNISLIDVLACINEPGYYDILQSSEEKLIIKSQSGIYYIRLTKQNNKLKMTAETKDATDSEFRYLITNLLNASAYADKAKKVFISSLEAASENENMYFGEQKAEQYLLNGYTITSTDNTKIFVLMLEEY